MKNTTNVMACGCAVVMEKDGKMVTSVDQLVNFIHRLTARSESRQDQRRTATVRA